MSRYFKIVFYMLIGPVISVFLTLDYLEFFGMLWDLYPLTEEQLAVIRQFYYDGINYDLRRYIPNVKQANQVGLHSKTHLLSETDHLRIVLQGGLWQLRIYFHIAVFGELFGCGLFVYGLWKIILTMNDRWDSQKSFWKNIKFWYNLPLDEKVYIELEPLNWGRRLLLYLMMYNAFLQFWGYLTFMYIWEMHPWTREVFEILSQVDGIF